jgi:4-hydroxybenzoyl-CoA thioesterase/acyl-CoA thioester hydrolase
MAGPFRTQRRVEFCDTDMAGIAHFSAFFKYMESAEHELLRQLGLSVVASDDQGPFGFPRVGASCDFISPVRFEDVLDIEVLVGGLSDRSVTYQFDFTHQGRKVASGKMTSVCCRLHPGSAPSSIPIPAAVANPLKGMLRSQ